MTKIFLRGEYTVLGKIEASVENGVLTVLVPKAEEAKPKKIAVKAK